MIKANVTTDCPTYEQINLLYPDTSEPKISGGFSYDDDYYHREPTKVIKHYRYYEFHKEPITWIDPPGDVINKMPRIYIAAGDFTYKIGKQTLTDTSYEVGNNRYVSSTCTEIIISAENWFFLLGDSVNHLLAGCTPESTNFDEIEIRKWQATKHDITTSAKYKLDKWVKESKELAKNYLIPK